MTNHTERLDRELAEIAQPLVDHLHEVQGEIGAVRLHLADLVVTQRRLTAIVRNIDPELAPVASNGKPKKNGVSQKRVDELAAWLQAHREELNAGEGIVGGELARSGAVSHIIKAQSGVNAAMTMLHEQGVIRLDHKGERNARYFKVV